MLSSNSYKHNYGETCSHCVGLSFQTVLVPLVLKLFMYIHIIQMVYRDRAKERREKYGTPAVVPGWKKRLEREIDKAKFSKYVQL